MYRTSHEFPTLKNTVEVLHRLYYLMENDQKIVLVELRFRSSSKNSFFKNWCQLLSAQNQFPGNV